MAEPRRVAIVGGGMAGLAAAWRLTRPDGPRPQVTVYQRGPRLGGKAASSRGPNGRIEEHGLHVWLGHYDNAFRLLRECYSELDRPTTDPGCPIPSWRDGFETANLIGLGERDADGWHDWLAMFPADDRLPGEPDADGTMSPAALAQRMVELISRLGVSMEGFGTTPRAVLSSKRVHRRPPAPAADALRGVFAGLRAAATDRLAGRRASEFADFLFAYLRGVVADDLLNRGFGAVDDEDISDWLRRHGVSESTLAGPFVSGLYDLAFAYVDGDPTNRQFPAGTGLHLAGRNFADYKGALFWKMRAGMGDVVIAPLYQALRRRGVRFEFFHRLDDVHLDAAGQGVDAVTFGRQVRLRPGVDQYDPLVRVGGLPVFPRGVDRAQVDAGPELDEHDLESHFCQWPDAERVRLERGRDFDTLVLAVSIGMVPYTCQELLAAEPRWQAMVDNIRTVATHAFQLWLTADERALGWQQGPASVTGVGHPFDTYASMSQTLAFEEWDGDGEPRTAASFCAVMPETSVPALDDPEHDQRARDTVRVAAEEFLEEHAANLWPGVGATGGGFRWDLLAGGEGEGRARFASQYWCANTDPSDRYVQATPGSGAYRLRPDDSGFDHLVLAGDWTDNGVNAGCIEAAVVSGLEAANAVEGRAIDDGVGAYRPRGARRARETAEAAS